MVSPREGGRGRNTHLKRSRSGEKGSPASPKAGNRGRRNPRKLARERRTRWKETQTILQFHLRRVAHQRGGKPLKTTCLLPMLCLPHWLPYQTLILSQ